MIFYYLNKSAKRWPSFEVVYTTVIATIVDGIEAMPIGTCNMDL